MKIIKIILIIVAIIIIGGVALGYYYSSLPGHNPQVDEQSY